MNFESLPNELLFEIFEQLNSIQLLQSFYNLNIRLNQLIYIYFRQYPLNFHAISQSNFDFISQNCLPSIHNQIYSLTLSDDDETPNLPSIFLFQINSLHQFINLHSLTLHSIHSFEILHRLLLHSPELSHLNLIQCGYYLNKMNLLSLTNTIWNLSKLIHCQFDCFSIGQMNFPRMTSISYSIEYLSIQNLHCDLNDLSHIFQHTPNLHQLHQNIECNFQTEQIHSKFVSLKHLNLIFDGSKYSLEKLFQKLPNLQALKIHLLHIYLNGYEWEKIFRNDLISLQNFQLKMTFEYHHSTEIDQLIESFQTNFWIELHQWFIRCDWFTSNATVYTLPYAFEEFIYSNNYQTKCTCLNENHFWIYNQVKKMIFEKNSYQYSARFTNVRHLSINCSLDESIELGLDNFDHLYSLDIVIRNDFSYILFENLIKRIKSLYSLKVKFFNQFPLEFFRLQLKSIPRIDFIGNSIYHIRYLTNDECDTILNSSWIQQCQILLINIENRMNLMKFISKINHLKSLIFRCKDDINHEEFSQWITRILPVTFKMTKDQKDISINRLWINK